MTAAPVEVRMFRDNRSFSCVCLILLSAFFAACSSPQPPAEQAAKPAEAARADASVSTDMHEHLSRVSTMLDAVIRGDLDAVAAPANWIAGHDAPALPAEAASFVPDMRKIAAMAAGATDVKAAGTATAQLVAACGACHQAVKAPIDWPEPLKPAGATGIDSHMLDHQWAVDLMYQGLAMPSEAAWKKGTEALTGSPMAAADLPKDEKLTKEIQAFEKKVHELAAKAGIAADVGSKVAVYAETIAACASCHGLHGKVWGPGIPK